MLLKKIFIGLFFLCTSKTYAYNVGLLVMATGKYIQFVSPLLQSARYYFCTNHKVTFYIFTDGEIEQSPDVVRIQQKRLGWPYDSMMRFASYRDAFEYWHAMDYLFACDADMLFVDPVGDEILGQRVATLHPGFVASRGTYETDKKSLAYVGPKEGKYYFAGGFYGGSCREFLTLLNENAARIEKDLAHNIIAVWHDESHLNRYFIDHEPTSILPPSYCYPGNQSRPYKRILLALEKDHAVMRK